MIFFTLFVLLSTCLDVLLVIRLCDIIQTNMITKQKGFTIVELLIVIVVIGILAAIVIVAFNGVQARANFSREKSDVANINKVIQLYYADNNIYPMTSDWVGWDQAANFVPGLVPAYASSLPQMPTTNANNDSYLYRSNTAGTEYKLIRYSEAATGLPSVQRTDNALMDPQRVNRAWGFWSSGGSGL